MRKIILPLLLILFALNTSAYAYEIKFSEDISLSDSISAVATDSLAGIVAAASKTSNTLYIIDVNKNIVVNKYALAFTPVGLAMDEKRGLLIIASDDNTLRQLDIKTGGVIKTIAPDFVVEHIAIHKETDTLYLAGDKYMQARDLETFSIIKERELPFPVTSMAIDKGGRFLLLAKEKPGLYVYAPDNLEYLYEIRSESIFSSVAVNPSTRIAALTNTAENSLSVASLEGGQILDNISLNERPNAVAIDWKNNVALIAHDQGIAKIQLENPVPSITTLVPKSAREGEPGLTLTVEGANFVNASQTGFNEKNMPTYFVTNETLKAEISPENLTSHGDVPVTVTSPPPGGGASNACSFRIYTPAPVLDALFPAAVITGSSVTLKVRGRNFFNGSTVNLNGENLKTRFISSILLEAEAGTSYTQKTGLYPVVVINPAPNSFTSNMKNLAVIDEKDSVQANLSDAVVQANTGAGVGSLRGRIVNTNLVPLEGVELKIKNLKSVTDSDGYFLLEDIPAGKRLLLIDGSTEKGQADHYPTIPINVDIEPGTINEMPFQVYLHKQKNSNFKDINPAEDTILTDPEVPGFEMRIPNGVNITGWDGQVNLKVSVRTVPTDRLPVKPLPQNAMVRTVYMFYFNKIGGGTPDQPIPIKSRNDLNLLPGEKAVLWYYDESPNEGEAPNDWAIAGTGTVTPDGMYIVSDPGVGMPKFCCGAGGWGGGGAGGPGGPNGGPPPSGYGGGGSGGGTQPDCDTSPSDFGGEPVELSSGLFIHAKSDLHIPGIIPVNIIRYHRPGDTGLGAFGSATYFEYDWWLGAYGADGAINKTNPTMLKLIKPGNSQFKFPKQPDGTFVNTTNPEMRGAKVIDNGDSTRSLKMRDGWTYKFDYRGDMNGELIEIADRNGNKLTFARHSDFEGGYITTITTQEGRTVTFSQTYTGNFYRTDLITDSAGRSVKYTYEADPFSAYPRLKQVQYPDGGALTYGYDPNSGLMMTITNEKGIVELTNEYNPDKTVKKQTQADGSTFVFNYIIAGGHITETSMTAPNGAITTWRFYDDTGAYRDGYITKKITPYGTTTYERASGTNEVISVTDPLGRKKTYTYYSTTDATNGLMKTMTDPLGNVTSYEYEPTYGQMTKITDALGKITTIAYTFSAGKITKIETKDPLLNLTTINYNTYGMPTSITDPNNNTTTFLYENAGRPTELTKIIDPLNNASLTAYDSLGRVSQVTDADGNITSYGYDMMNRVTSVTDALGGVTRYYYDVRGKLTMVIDAKNNMILYEYDDRDRLIKMTDQLGRFETYAYYRDTEITSTTGDNLKSVTDRRGRTTTYNQYDLMNRLKKITYHDGSYTDFTYDAVGRADYINDSVSGYIDYTYNDFGCSNCSGRGTDRISKEVTPLGTIDYTYDKVGKRLTMTVAGQNVVNYVYDAAGRMTSLSQKIGNSTRTYPLTYDNGSRRTSFKIPISTKNKYVTTTYGYDIANRLLNMLHQGPSSQIENLLYEYDANGNRTSFTRNAAQTSRDAVTGTSYDDANEMLSFTSAAATQKNMTYDDIGNLISVTNDCGITNYTWDVRNRLVGINGFKADCSPLSASFSYDAVGRRIEKAINGTTTKYLYDGLDIIQEIQGTAKTNYIRTLNIDEPLTRIKADGTVRHYVRDALGSIIGLTDDTGVLKTTYTYDPFGNTTVSGEASDNPFQYTGRENDETGLYYYRARFYSPELQRFISEDPMGFNGGSINLYSYVGNNPVNWIDPEGLKLTYPNPNIPPFPDYGECKKEYDPAKCDEDLVKCQETYCNAGIEDTNCYISYYLCKAGSHFMYSGVCELLNPLFPPWLPGL